MASPFLPLSAHLGDLHVGWVPPHGAVLLPVAGVAHQLAVPDPEVSAARGALGEHGDGRANVGESWSEPNHSAAWGGAGLAVRALTAGCPGWWRT